MLFSENSLITKEQSSFHASSQLILSIVRPFKQSCPIVEWLQFLICFNTLKVHSPEATNAGKLAKTRSAL
jgi:hypothetical protein